MGSELDRDPVVQSRFVHEYVHYFQVLTGTIGRFIILDLAKTAIFAGIHKVYGASGPSALQRIDLRQVLQIAARTDFLGTEPALQYAELYNDLCFALAHAATPMPHGTPSGQFCERELQVGRLKARDFVHVTASHNGASYAIPVTDRVVFENMARQVQRNYLLFNNGLDTSPVDDLRRTSNGDLVYVCIRDAIAQRLPETEDPARWTIATCQLALLCRNPGTAIVHTLDRLGALKTPDLPDFLRTLGFDHWFKGEFNEPPIQELINDLVLHWGTAVSFAEHGELRELTELVSNAANAVNGNLPMMSSSLLRWEEVVHWISQFGCPPVRFGDGVRSVIQGQTTSAPWHWYFARIFSLL